MLQKRRSGPTYAKNGARKRERNNEYECWMPVPPSIFSYTFIEICMVDNSCFTSLFNTTCTFKSHSLACISTYAARSDVLKLIIRWSCYDKHIWLRGLQSLASSPFWCRTGELYDPILLKTSLRFRCDMLIKATQILVTSAKSLPQSSNPHLNFMSSLRETGPGAYVYLSRPSAEVSGEVWLTQSTLTC